MRRTATTRDGGFTLVELLVVVMILGILTAIGLPGYLSQRRSAWRGQMLTDTRSAVVALDAEFAHRGGRYPPDQAAFDALAVRTSDPGVGFTYRASDSGEQFCLVAAHTRLGEDEGRAYASGAGGLQDTGTCPSFERP